MSMDPRIAARRRQVLEGSARHSLVRLMRWLGAGAVLATVMWFAQSTPFQLATISVHGVTYSSTADILEAEQVIEGRPLLYVRTRAVQRALLTDPWIADATVGVVFPDAAEVVVVERAPIAWVATTTGETLLAAQGGVAVPGDKVEVPLPSVSLRDVKPVATGDVLADTRILACLDFLAALDPAIGARGALSQLEDELWFFAPGLKVRLGRPIEMVEKAAALMALVERGIPPDATVHLVAPTRPAIETPDG